AHTVESHASTIGPATLELKTLVSGRLEVAVGLETIHPVAMEHLNKRLALARFDSAAEFLAGHDIDLRAFVLLGLPYVPVQESIAWTIRSVEYAVARGAKRVAIIPVRSGNGELERLQALGACYDLAAHGRWVVRFPELGRGLKRGFTFYRHHAGRPFAVDGTRTERLLVAASPNDHVADNHWLRADVDHHFVRAAVAAGVEYRDRTDVTAELLKILGADFVVDASGPGGFLARQLDLPSALHR